MRTNRERLIETLEDMILDHELGRSPYSLVKEYADRIMDAIDNGVIQAEPPQRDPVDEHGRRTGKASFYGDK